MPGRCRECKLSNAELVVFPCLEAACISVSFRHKQTITTSCARTTTFPLGRTNSLRCSSASRHAVLLTAVHKKVWDVMHETGCRTDLTIPLITADSTPHRTYGLLPNITFSIGSFKVTVQAHIVHEGPFDVLIGQPFRAITRMHSQVDFDGSEIIELRDPVNNTKFAISTHLHDMRNNKFAKGHERDFRPPRPPKTPPIQHAPQGDDHVHDHDHDHDHDHGHPVDLQQSRN